MLALKDELAQQAQFAGPMFCKADQFWNFLLFEKRRMLHRGGETALVIVMVKTHPNGETPYNIKDVLEQAIRQSLRNIDLGCYLSGKQMAILLPMTGLKGSNTAIEHIKAIFHRYIPPQQVTLHTRVKLIPQIKEDNK